jgi:hypothetical protein
MSDARVAIAADARDAFRRGPRDRQARELEELGPRAGSQQPPEPYNIVKLLVAWQQAL